MPLASLTRLTADNQGNITARGSQGFYFDQGNRMVLANGVASYSYDGLGRRTGINDANGYRIQVYSQGGQLLYGTLQSTTVSNTRYIYLGGKLIAEDGSNGKVFSHTDALGSPVARTNASGALLSRTRYEAYGNTAAGTVPGGIGFTGHVNDPGTGLVYRWAVFRWTARRTGKPSRSGEVSGRPTLRSAQACGWLWSKRIGRPRGPKGAACGL